MVLKVKRYSNAKSGMVLSAETKVIRFDALKEPCQHY
jgi:hypothetical protein